MDSRMWKIFLTKEKPTGGRKHKMFFSQCYNCIYFNRYPLVYSLNMLDIALINSYIILKSNGHIKLCYHSIKVVANLPQGIQSLTPLYVHIQMQLSAYGPIKM